MTGWDGSITEPDPNDAGPEAEAEDTEDVEDVEEPEDAGTDEPTDDGEDADAPALIGGKFKTADDLLQSYNELQRRMHEQAEMLAQLQQPQDDEPDDPFGLWGTVLDSDDGQKLAEIIVQQPHRAQQVVEWVQQNTDQFGPDGDQILDGVFALWNAQNPRAAQAWIADQRLQVQMQEIQARQAPLEEAHAVQMMNAAVARASNELPNFMEYWPKILERISRPEVQRLVQADESYRSDPNKAFGLIEAAMSQIALEEWKQNMRQAASEANQADGTTVKKPRTQARSSVAAPAQDDVRDLFPPGTFREE